MRPYPMTFIMFFITETINIVVIAFLRMDMRSNNTKAKAIRAIIKQRNCNEIESTGAKNFSPVCICMQSSKGIENEPTVGNKFFENIPPVGKTNILNPLRNFSGVKQARTTNVTDTRKLQKQREVLKGRDTTTVKGFGGNPLYILGLLATSKDLGERIRLDDDTGNKDKLSDAEQILKRNSTIIRASYDEEILRNQENTSDANEVAPFELGLQDEILASDYAAGIRNFGMVRKHHKASKQDAVGSHEATCGFVELISPPQIRADQIFPKPKNPDHIPTTSIDFEYVVRNRCTI